MPNLTLESALFRCSFRFPLLGRPGQVSGRWTREDRARQFVEDPHLRVPALAAAVGEQNGSVGLPVGPGANEGRLGVGGLAVERPLSHQPRFPVDPDRVLVPRGDADVLEGEFQHLGRAAVLGGLPSTVAQGDPGVLELVGHDQPVGVVDPGAVAAVQPGRQRVGIADFHTGGEGAALPAVDVHQHGQIALLEADVPRPLVPDVQAETEEAPGDVAGSIPVGAAAQGFHDFVGQGDGFGVGTAGVEAGGRGIVAGVGEAGAKEEDQEQAQREFLSAAGTGAKRA